MEGEAFVSSIPVGRGIGLGRPTGRHLDGCRRCIYSVSRRVRISVNGCRVVPSANGDRSRAMDMDDGDESSIGNPGDHSKSLGVPLPPMSEDEYAWFIEAPNGKVRVERLMEIARKRHAASVKQNLDVAKKSGKALSQNVADEYMENLARASTESKKDTKKFKTSDEDRAAKRLGLNKGELYMDNLTTKPPPPEVEMKVKQEMDAAFVGEKRTAPAHPTTAGGQDELHMPVENLDGALADLDRELQELKADEERKRRMSSIRQSIPSPGASEPPVAAKPPATTNSSTVDGALADLERELQELKADEERKKQVSSTRESVPSPAASGPPAAAKPPSPTHSSVVDSALTDLERELQELKAKDEHKKQMSSTRQSIPRPAASEPPAVAKPASPTNSSTVDKQLSYLEQHLAKLQAEHNAGPGSDTNSENKSAPDPEVVKAQVKSFAEQFGNGGKQTATPGALGDGIGGLSEDETLAAFEEIRAAQAEMAQAAPADPLAMPLPSRADGVVADIGNASWDDGAPSGAADIAEDARLALISLRIEHSRFVTEQRKVLKEHEEKVAAIFERYVPDLS